ncbi:cytosine permease [Arthroderma uncinatum]|uniref:cytosine permease n=1 Tax=Arthroderma uncinatum TaxID=74035 RepID=UPI00144ACB3A|nr:cytosine permease [Arthroderma uncinatum]KAF3479702.1 cytosine permease [Arthroderma uncinatum]
MGSTKDEANPGANVVDDNGFRLDLENSQPSDQKAEVRQGDSIQSREEDPIENPEIKTVKIERVLRQIELWLGQKLNIETQGIERIKEEDKQPPSLWNAFLMWWINPKMIAWFALHGILTGYAVISTTVSGQLLPAAADYTVSTNVGIFIVSALSLAISFFGFSIIHKFESYSWILAFVLLCVLLGQSAPHIKPEMIYFNHRREGFAASFLSYLSFTVAGTSGWSTAIADYYCHYPTKISSWKLTTLTLAGFASSSVFISIIGTCIGLIALDPTGPFSEAFKSHGLGGVVREISHPLAWSKFMLVMLLFTVLGGLIANYYSCGLSIQVLGQHFRYLPRFIWSLLIAILVTTLSVLGKDHLIELIGNLGNMLGYLTAAYSVILFMEDRWFRRHDGYDLTAWNDKHRLPWGLAAVASLVVSYMAGAIPGMNTTWFIGPIAAKFGTPAGDVGLILNTTFTVITYFTFRTIEKRMVGR